MKNTNPNSFDGRFDYAAALEEQGRFAEALDHWRQLASDRKDVEVLCRLGGLASELGHLEEAERAFRQVIQIDDKLALAYVALANMLADRGQHEDAVGFFRKALSLEKTEYAYTMFGALLIMMGRDEEAIENLRAALTVDPEFEEAYFNLGVIKSKTDQPEAERLFSKAVELAPEYAAAHQELGWFLRKRNDLPRAKGDAGMRFPSSRWQ